MKLISNGKPWLALTAAACVVALVACGGGERGSSDTERATLAAQDSLELFDSNGRARLSSTALVPGDTDSRTRSGLYATLEQYEWQELTARPYTVLLDVEEAGSVDAAVNLALQVRGYWSNAAELAYFVRARRGTDGAAVVNLLADQGFAPVFLIV